METVAAMEMEMEAAGDTGMSLKALFQRRVVMVHAHCRTLHGLLHGLVVAFSEQRDMVCGGVEKEEARRALVSASAELGLAFANMGAARHLALGWCGRRALELDTDPGPRAASLSASTSDDDGGLLADPNARRTLGLLREAAELVPVVHDLVEGARGHMAAAEVLLLALGEKENGDGRGRDAAVAPWVHAPCTAELLDGVMYLAEAFSQATELVELTAAAREAAFGVGED